MPELVLTADFTDVEVVRPRPFGRPGEEAEVRRFGVRHEEVAKPLQLRDVAPARLDGGHRHPTGVVFDDAEGRVEAIVQRWMALQVASV
jgi:hypothetical protein